MSLFAKLTNSTNIPPQFPQWTHPMPPPDNNGDEPVQTNKFYANMLLEKRTLYAYTQPYSLWWTGTDVDGFCGLAVSHEDANRREFGPDAGANPVRYFFSPAGVMNVCLGASWGVPPTFSTNSWGPLSVNAVLRQNSAEVVYPLCSGMGFVTGIYTGTAPVVGSQVGFKSVTEGVRVRNGLTRVCATLENNTIWLIYVSLPNGGQAQVAQQDHQHIVVHNTESNIVVQVAKVDGSAQDWLPVVDSAAGAYPTQVTLDGGVTSDFKTASYAFNYDLAGSSTGGGTLVYAAPHHVESFTSTMNGKVTKLYLNSPCLGMLRLCVTGELEMYERLPADIGFLPWYQHKSEGDGNFSFANFTGAVNSQIAQVAENEIGVDVHAATNLSSMYFSGKAMSKFANILLVLTFVTKDRSLAQKALRIVKDAFNTFVQNKQQTPLFYDQSWKGLVSQNGREDAMADFGNTYYNDHHFHYGYFIHSAAIIAKCDQEVGDGSWIKQAQNVDWVNSLVRDVATFGDDKTYPESRMFDWYAGHGFAKGLFASADGKDEESSSEDYNCWYGMKLWGSVIGDKSLESRANLIIAIEARSMNHYMLYRQDNTTEPKNFIGNFVAGIKFENKIEHSTYFGMNPEFIHGIHMVPITPISSFVRSPDFVREEWEAKIKSFVNNVDSGWKGVLYLNYALTNPQAAYDFFSSPSFQPKWLDDGLTHTWCLAFSRALC